MTAQMSLAPRRGARTPVDPVDAERARLTYPAAIDGPVGARRAVDPNLWLLHVQYERLRTPALGAELVEEYTAFAYSLARRSFRHGEPLEDLRQVAMVSLITALDRFQCERSIPFTAFAAPTIVGSLKRHHRDHGWAMRVPRQAHDVAVALPLAEARLDARLGAGQATDAQVATELGLDVATLDRSRGALRARATMSIDAPRSRDGDRQIEICDAERGYGRVEDRIDLRRALDALPPGDRDLLGEYYFEGRSQREIGRSLGVSQMQVSRMLRSATARLRTRMRRAG